MKQKKIVGIVIVLIIVSLTYFFSGLATVVWLAVAMLLNIPIYNQWRWVGNGIVCGVAVLSILFLQSILLMSIAVVVCEIAMLVGCSIIKLVVCIVVVIGIVVIFGLWKWNSISLMDVWNLTKSKTTIISEIPNIIPELEVGKQKKFAFDFNGKLDKNVFTFPAPADSAYQFSVQNNAWMLVSPKAAGLKIAGFKLDEFLSNFVSVNNRGWEVPPTEIVSLTTPDGKYALPKPGQTLRIKNNGAITIGLHAPKLDRRDVPGLLFASVSPNGRGGFQAAPLIISVTRIVVDATAEIVSPNKIRLKTFIGIDKKLSDTSWIEKSLADTDAAIASGTSEYAKPLVDDADGLWKLAKKMAGFPTPTPTFTPATTPTLIPTATPALQTTAMPTVSSATN